MRIALGADHAGFALKEKLVSFVAELGYEIIDKGAFSYDKDDDYPDFIISAVRAVADDEADRAIVVGSSGQGEGMAANKVKGVRAAVYYGHKDHLPQTKKTGQQKGLIASAREDNDSNVLAIGASFVNEDEAKQAVKEWLETPFSNEERHVRRIKKLD
ncbi:MAG: RpiB/LacA/LacB family sugar-phosphate isomerase [Patescibacteria group bacterium]